MRISRAVAATSLVRLIVLPVTLLAFASACQGWVGIRTAPGEDQVIPGPTRVTLTDGRQVELGSLLVTEDSLFGNPPGISGPIVPDRSTSFSLEDVKQIQEKGTDGGSTALLIGGIVALTVAAAAAMNLWGEVIECGTVGAIGGEEC